MAHLGMRYKNMILSDLLKFTPSQKATYIEVNTGTDDVKYITPSALDNSYYEPLIC